MPKPGVWVELISFLKRSEYLLRLRVEEQEVRYRLDRRGVWRFYGNRSSYRRSRRRSKSSIGKFMQCFESTRAFSEVQRIQNRLLLIRELLHRRYLDPRTPIPSSTDWLTKLLPESPDHIFKHHTRMSREAFGKVVHIIDTKTPHHFTNKSACKQLPVSVQLNLALFVMGFSGNGAALEQARVKFGVSQGKIINGRQRVFSALVEIAAEYIRWPEKDEIKILCEEVRELYGYHDAFFCVDGTTQNFSIVPGFQTNTWYDRKHINSMKALVSNDIHLRVIHLVVGWHSSTNDKRTIRSASRKDPAVDEDMCGVLCSAGAKSHVYSEAGSPLYGFGEFVFYSNQMFFAASKTLLLRMYPFGWK